MNTTLKYVAALLAAFSIVSSLSAEVVVRFEFDEDASTTASNAVNTGTSGTDVALDNSWGTINGNGQLVVTGNQNRSNVSLGSHVISGTSYYRLDFATWDTSTSTESFTKKVFAFGPRLRSAPDPEGITPQTNNIMLVNLDTGTSATNASLKSNANAARANFHYIKGGLSSIDGFSVIIEVNTTANTYTIWTDLGLEGNYTAELNDTDQPLQISNSTDFTQVNALTFDPGGGTFTINRIALGDDFGEISTLYDAGDLQALVADLQSQLATVTSERDALPTQSAYDAVVAERDARNARIGEDSMLISVDPNTNQAAIQFVVEETSDLDNWASGSTTTKTIQLTIPDGQDIRFYRFVPYSE